LLAQILMASTYPLEVVEAARCVSAPANRTLTGSALTNTLQAQNWDPSIEALVPFPRVLANMSASTPTNRRRKADRLETLMQVFAVRRLSYRAGL